MPGDGPEVLLYGATGYTGRLVADGLEARGIDFEIAGRDAGRLRRVSASLPSQPACHAAGIDDAAALERLARRARVVVSTAGPYIRCGRPLLEAALDAGSHFIDVAGEQSFLRWAHGQDARARDADVTVVDAMGFDVIPGDVAAVLATKGIADADLHVGYAVPAAASRGTLASMVANVGQGAWYADGGFRPASPGRFCHRFHGPDGIQDGLFVPWGDVVTAPRSTGARRVRTYFIGPTAQIRAAHAAWPILAAAWRSRLAALALRARLARHRDPTPEERAGARWRVVAEAVGEDGTGRASVTGRDPYGFTAEAVAEGAGRLARRDTPRGVLTFTQAFDHRTFFPDLKGWGLEVHRSAADHAV